MIPDISTLWVVFFLLLCTVLLNTLIFKPILKVIEQRTAAVRTYSLRRHRKRSPWGIRWA